MIRNPTKYFWYITSDLCCLASNFFIIIFLLFWLLLIVDFHLLFVSAKKTYYYNIMCIAWLPFPTGKYKSYVFKLILTIWYTLCNTYILKINRKKNNSKVITPVTSSFFSHIHSAHFLRFILFKSMNAYMRNNLKTISFEFKVKRMCDGVKE